MKKWGPFTELETKVDAAKGGKIHWGPFAAKVGGPKWGLFWLQRRWAKMWPQNWGSFLDAKLGTIYGKVDAAKVAKYDCFGSAEVGSNLDTKLGTVLDACETGIWLWAKRGPFWMQNWGLFGAGPQWALFWLQLRWAKICRLTGFSS